MTDNVSQTADSGVFGGESYDVVDDLPNVAETAEEVAAKAGAEAEGVEGQSENGQPADDAGKPEGEPAAEGQESEGGEGEDESAEGGEEEAKASDAQQADETEKEWRDRLSRERDAHLRVRRTFRKELQRQIEDGATVEDIAEAHEVSVSEIEAVLDDSELNVLDSANPIEAKGQEIAKAYTSNQRLADAYVKNTLGEDVSFQDIAYNVSVAASGDENFRKDLLAAPQEDLVAICVDKYADMKKNNRVVSMNPMQDIASLRDENAALKAEIEQLKAGGVKQETSQNSDNAPVNGAKGKTEDDRPRMNGSNDLVHGEELAQSSVFGNL